MNSIACAVDKTVFGDDHYHHQPLEYATALLLIQIAVSQSVRRLHHQLARERLQTSTHCVKQVDVCIRAVVQLSTTCRTLCTHTLTGFH